MQIPIPPEVMRRVRPVERDEVAAWWRGLDGSTRAELIERWDRRSEHPSLQLDRSSRRRWRRLPVLLEARLVHPDEVEALEPRDLWEYVNSHEEVRFFLHERTFRVCRAHAAARAVLERGVIPAGFVCPRTSAACPFALASRPDRAIVLERSLADSRSSQARSSARSSGSA